MERRGSNIETSAVRHSRRRSAVTIIAPGEEANPFQQDAVNVSFQKQSLPAYSRFDNFKANPREEEDGVNEVPASAPRGPPPSSSAAPSASVMPGRVNGLPNDNTVTRNGASARRALSAPLEPSRFDGPPAADWGAVPVSASKCMSGLHVFPQTPPTVAVAPAQLTLTVRNGNVLVAAAAPPALQFPSLPNGRSNRGGSGSDTPGAHAGRGANSTPVAVAVLAGVPPRRGGPVPQAASSSTVNGISPAGRLSVTSRRGQTPPLAFQQSALSHAASAVGPSVGLNASSMGAVSRNTSSSGTSRSMGISSYASAPPLQPPPSSAAAKWTSAARRQQLNANAGSYNSGRRATVPQGGTPQRRGEQQQVPHPPSRGSATSSASVSAYEEDGRKASVLELSSLLSSTAASDTSSTAASDDGRDSFARYSDSGRDPSIVIEEGGAAVGPSAAAAGTQSPTPDYCDFLKPALRRKLAEMAETPASPPKRQKQHPMDTSTRDGSTNPSAGEGERATAAAAKKTDASSTQNGKGSRKGESNPLGGLSLSQREPLTLSDISNSFQSPLFFTPLEELREAVQFDAKPTQSNDHSPVTSTPAADVSATERSGSSLADYSLTDTATDATGSGVNPDSLRGPVNARQRRNRPVVRLPSPVELNSVQQRGKGNGPTTSSPPLLATKHRANLAHRHGTNSREQSVRAGATTAAGKSISVDSWDFDYLVRNGLVRVTEKNEILDESPSAPHVNVPGTSAAAAPSPTSTGTTNNHRSSSSSRAEQKWLVTQSLSINPAEFSFDHLSLNQQCSTVAKLRRVFESQRKPIARGDGGAANPSSTVRTPPEQTESPRGKESGSLARKQSNSLALSTGSTVAAPCSEESSKASSVADGGTDSGRSAVVRTSVSAPSTEFSFNRLTPPRSADTKAMTLPPISSTSHPNPAPMRATSFPSNASGDDFHLSRGTSSTDGASPIYSNFTPSRSKGTNATLLSLSMPAGDAAFSLSRFHNLNSSFDTVNMSDHRDV
ncbi:hypothetical protein ABB37_05854 [Leptomonas pyrrhocoris]|uniref:Uncharacterized protein n=1 Tax=Leptomonas pyrrhocoris TaxID=157538 RepID=A0A0M9FYI0_LEPPY|nr:hypothetical protein ABB37_05854 [Leptomonas pyrrhocoris]KPA78730.1 hypothetical protein ABB37_05854 [Leptomonas pyrrhocoris]|eukprot:XP_015657169.1 hypothetical protein ABB37_05854 [Leptomonas pyrrhocoris]